uniref:Uncharacterized protein n=1 Tax=Rhizobium leguminosarum TaxID=384 RepID=A0A154I8D9_RHILE|nr:hypothetical protein A4A59_34040 [Rhizobium leguminosarum]
MQLPGIAHCVARVRQIRHKVGTFAHWWQTEHTLDIGREYSELRDRLARKVGLAERVWFPSIEVLDLQLQFGRCRTSR